MNWRFSSYKRYNFWSLCSFYNIDRIKNWLDIGNQNVDMVRNLGECSGHTWDIAITHKLFGCENFEFGLNLRSSGVRVVLIIHLGSQLTECHLNSAVIEKKLWAVLSKTLIKISAFCWRVSFSYFTQVSYYIKSIRFIVQMPWWIDWVILPSNSLSAKQLRTVEVLFRKITNNNFWRWSQLFWQKFIQWG